ncbi:hypothetical protein [Pontibacter ruber]|uniref:Uncharacterized protein n=1 Tax=Pontibacter ruber TaxID=1343895 RepID=A0ABW5CWW2_9BACT|nr:hypothetical protein [Pontibacter ruber]
MKTKFTLCMLSLLLVSGFYTSSQAQVLQKNDMEGKVVHEYSTIDMQGSPYLHPEWASGTVTLANGRVYEGLELMYDQVKDMLLFKGKDNQPRELLEPVKEFKISYIQKDKPVAHIFRKGYSGDGEVNAFYEVLTDGKTSLLRRTTKAIFDRKGYSSATIVREVQQKEDFFIASGDKLVKIRKDKKSVMNALAGDKDKLEVYIRANALNLREDEDLAKLIAYHNSLN